MLSRRFKRNSDDGWSMYLPEAHTETWQRSFPRSPAPKPGHVVLRSRNGEVTVVNRPGLSQPFDLFRQVDQRRSQLSFAPQSVPTAQGLDVTLTFVLTTRVVDAVRYVTSSADPNREVYLAAQIALRELVSTMQLNELVGTRIDLSPVAAAAAKAARDVGLEIVGTIHLKDITLPHRITDALSQAEVDKLAAETDLERARTEVKITRARMGTAKVLEQNPLLAKIRLLEALPPGTTLEVRDSN
ncbi:SPFH domain-containing protein [Corynebacterium mayonis]|uniref:SPFH domain-containing protein n=1 Tax=Corynebacterium mayonis TaxID=3062461 RepID=UPI003140BF92